MAIGVCALCGVYGLWAERENERWDSVRAQRVANSPKVFVTPEGRMYHNAEHYAGSREMSLYEAKEMGLEACKVCFRERFGAGYITPNPIEQQEDDTHILPGLPWYEVHWIAVPSAFASLSCVTLFLVAGLATKTKTAAQIVTKEAATRVSLARARELREQEVRLRDLDVRIADSFGFYTSLDWYAKSRKEPTGLPRYARDYDHHHQPDERLRKTIPRYSTDMQAFIELERRIRGQDIYELYLEVLIEKGQDETTATLEQKCIAALKARRRPDRPRGI